MEALIHFQLPNIHYYPPRCLILYPFLSSAFIFNIMNTGNNNFRQLTSLNSFKQIIPTTVYMLLLISVFKYSEKIPKLHTSLFLTLEEKWQNIGKNSCLEIRRPHFSSGLIITKYEDWRKKHIRGTWVSQLVKPLTHDFGSDCDPMVCRALH